MPEQGLLEALLAEPVIRAMGSSAAGAAEITVCHECADLFAGHPAVGALSYSYPEQVTFDEVVTLRSMQGKEKTMDRIYEYAAQAATELAESEPRLFLNSFDLIRMQRFGLGRLAHPRIALALPDFMEEGGPQAWAQLCRALGEGMKAGVVLLGRDSQVPMPLGRDLRGKLMARETAAVMSQCDVLVSSEAEMIWMATAVKVPAVFVGSEAMARMVCPDAGRGLFVCAESPEEVIGALSRLQEQAGPKMQEGTNE